MTVKMGGNYPLPGEKMDFNHCSLDSQKCRSKLRTEPRSFNVCLDQIFGRLV